MHDIPWFWLFVGSYVVWVVLAVLGLLQHRRSPTATLAWIFAFVALPVVSGLYYMVFGPRRMRRRKRRYGLARSAASQVSERLRATSRPLAVDLGHDASGLAAVGRRLGQGDPTCASTVALYDSGDEKMRALEAAIERAHHHVHMEYYIWEPDRIGTHFRDRLAHAARRGVEVRVLYDAVGSPHVSEAFWKPLRDAGGEVLAFNRVRLSIASLHFANFRTHRKMAILDGIVGFLGGMNMHDSEMGGGSSSGSGSGFVSGSGSGSGSEANAWRDAHARIEGEPVRKIQRLFLENWTYAGGAFRMTPANVAHYFPDARGQRGRIPVQILASGPDDEEAPLHAFYLAALASARSRIWIETPYLIPDEPLEAALRIAELRGVDVQVIVPARGDSALVNAASRTYCQSLARAGIVIFEYGPPMLHAKTLIVDETVGVVGTANLDNRSFRLNFEVVAAFYDPGVIGALAQRFQDDRADSRPFPPRRRNQRLTTIFESLARLTSPVL